MATLYVENVPEDLYKALRERARGERRSIAAEVLTLLEESIPTEKVLKRRREATRRLDQLRFTSRVSDKVLPSSEEMIREDRER